LYDCFEVSPQQLQHLHSLDPGNLRLPWGL
jgi:hypothetical protein